MGRMMIDVMNKLLLLSKHATQSKPIRILAPSLSLDVGAQCIANLLHEMHWKLRQDSSTPNTVIMVAENANIPTVPSCFNRAPQIIQWTLTQCGKDTLIELRFAFTARFSSKLLGTMALLFLAYLLLPSIILAPYNTPPSRAIGIAIQIGALHSLILLYCLMLTVFCIDKYIAILRTLYSFLQTTSARPISIIEENFPLPGYRLLLILTLFSVAFPVYNESLLSLPHKAIPDSALYILLAFGSILCGGLLYFTFIPAPARGRGGRGEGSAVYLSAGAAVIFYSLIPLSIDFVPSDSAVEEIGGWLFDTFFIPVVMIFLLMAILHMGFLLIPGILLPSQHLHDSPALMESRVHQTSLFKCTRVSLFQLAIWLTTIPFTMLSYYYVVIGIAYYLLGATFPCCSVLPQQMALYLGTSTAVFLYGLYSVPLVLAFMIIAYRWMRDILIVILRNNIPIQNTPTGESLKRVCRYADAQIPKLWIVSAGIDEELIASVIHVPLGGNMVILSHTILEHLTPLEIEAILAHEIYHVKKHSNLVSFLEMLSRITLFGTGFLLCVLNTEEIEYDADKFAIGYLKDELAVSPRILVQALDKVSILKGARRLNRKIITSSPMVSLQNTIPNNLTYNQQIPFRIRIQCAFELIFGDIVTSYVYPTLEARIKAIEAELSK